MSTVSQPLDQGRRFGLQWALSSRLRAIIQVGALVLLLWLAWSLSAVPIVVTVDGIQEAIRTHRRTLAPLLVDLDLTLHPADRLSHPAATRLTSDLHIRIDRARALRVLADGRDLAAYSWGGTPREVLEDAGVAVDNYDQVVVNGRRQGLDDPLPARGQRLQASTYDSGYAWQQLESAPLQIRVYRSIPIQVDDGTVPFTVNTTAQTVGEALREAEITLYLGDRVQPSLGSPVSTGLRVYIQRSTPVTLQVDDQLVKTRTRGRTVGDALTEMGIGLSGLDRVSPALDVELFDNLEIQIVRVHEEMEVEEEIVPFETIFRADPNLAIDTQQVVNAGAEGITRTRTRLRFEDSEEVDRIDEDTWVAQEPAQRIIAYGQKITPRTAVVEGQSITYWRKIRMKASSYSAGTAGVSPDAPWYGRTRTGDQMRFGVVAVDPKIIPLRSEVYIPGYGYGDALDTGSAIISKRIDLGYDDSNLVLWNRWVDVYLLWPPPPTYQITWVLPNWPVEP